jgi:hypothetical protein
MNENEIFRLFLLIWVSSNNMLIYCLYLQKRECQYYDHMWYTLPWAFDQFFHESIPYRWMDNVHSFEIPSQKMTSIDHSFLRTLNASGQTLPSFICSLSHVALSNYIEILHLSYYNRSIHIDWSTLYCHNSFEYSLFFELLSFICNNYSFSFHSSFMCFQSDQCFCIYFQLYHSWVQYAYLCMTYEKLSLIEAVKWL